MFKLSTTKKVLLTSSIASVIGLGIIAIPQPQNTTSLLQDNSENNNKEIKKPAKEDRNEYSSSGSSSASSSSNNIINNNPILNLNKLTPIEQEKANYDLALKIFGTNGDEDFKGKNNIIDFKYLKTNSDFKETRLFTSILNNGNQIDWKQKQDSIIFHLATQNQITNKWESNILLWSALVPKLLEKSLSRIPLNYINEKKAIYNEWTKYFIKDLNLQLDKKAPSFYFLPPVVKTRSLAQFQAAWYNGVKGFVKNYKIK